MTVTRRQFGLMAGAAAMLGQRGLLHAQTKPNSKIHGVQIGVITPYSYHNMPNDAESLLAFLVKDGLSATEIQFPPVETYAGAPKDAKEREAWRLAAPMDKIKALRTMYNDAGVTIYGFKLDLTPEMPDGIYDYAFNVTKLLGATQLTMEMPKDPAQTAKIGTFADKHKVWVGYHAHTQALPTTWDVAMSQSAYNGINLDLGHYTAAGNHDGLEFIRKNHKRITSMHLKDRKYKENGGQNMPWGQGDTPIKEALQMMKKEKYAFPATIELEYAPPAGSNSEMEIVKCLEYAKAALA